MIKKIILIFGLLLIIPLINSFDEQTFFSCGGDDEMIIGCLGDSELFFLGFDIINPQISIIYPTDDLVITNVVTGLYGLNVNFSVYDINLDSCWYRLSGVQNITNTSTPCSNGYNNFLITITNFGSLSLNIFTKDISNNENSSQVNFSISEYTGSQTGGGSTTDPSIRDTVDFKKYNSTIMCEKINNFLSIYPNYTSENRQNFKNGLSIIFGFGIIDNVLDEYLENFEENCPEYFEPDEPIEPDEPVDVDDEEGKYIGFWIVLGIILLMILLAMFFLGSRSKIIRLSKESIKKLIENLQKMIQ